MTELKEINEIYCVNCREKINQGNKLKGFPESFSVYLCPLCGHENEWWILHKFDKNINLQSIIRAIFFEHYLNRKEIKYDQIIQYIQEKYKDVIFSDDAIRDVLNSIYVKMLVSQRLRFEKRSITAWVHKGFYRLLLFWRVSIKRGTEDRII